MSINFFDIFTGDETSLSLSTSNSKSSVTITDNTGSNTRSCKLVINKICNLSVNLANTSGTCTITLYNSTGTIVLGTTSTLNSWVTLASNLAVGSYLIVIINSNLTAGNAIATFQASTITTISSWFPTGFVNQLPLGATVAVTRQTDGSLLYTFNNYTTTVGNTILLLTAGPAIQSGTIEVTASSGPFNSSTDAFTAPNGVGVYLTPTSSTIFTGTILVSINGSNTAVFLDSYYCRN